MAFIDLLYQRARLQRPGEKPDADGVQRPNPELIADDVPFRVGRPSDRTAFRDDAGRVLVDYVGFATADSPAAALQPDDEVIVDGVTYHVAGAVLPMRARGGVHHYEVPLRTEGRT